MSTLESVLDTHLFPREGLEQSLSLLEDAYSVTERKNILFTEIAQGAGLSLDEKSYVKYTDFCNQYLTILSRKSISDNAKNKQVKIGVDRMLRNWLVGSAAGLVVYHDYLAGILVGLSAYAATVYDALAYDHKLDLGSVLLTSIAGALIGNEFAGVQGRYIGFAAGAVIWGAAEIAKARRLSQTERSISAADKNRYEFENSVNFLLDTYSVRKQ